MHAQFSFNWPFGELIQVREDLMVIGTGFYRPNALLLTHPISSRHWRK